MVELKCPFCNQKLEPIGTSGQFQCGSLGCEASFNFIATRDVWEYIDKTRKALDAAVKAMESAKYFRLEHCMCCGHDPQKDEVYVKLKKAINEITALEQKDV